MLAKQLYVLRARYEGIKFSLHGLRVWSRKLMHMARQTNQYDTIPS